MPFVTVPKDLSKVKTKIVFNLTKRQLICFGIAAVIGVPTYLFTRKAIGNDGAVLLMMGLMLPFFFLAMYEKDGQPAEKVLRNLIRSRYLRTPIRPYKTQNLYSFNKKGAMTIADKKTKTTGKKASYGSITGKSK